MAPRKIEASAAKIDDLPPGVGRRAERVDADAGDEQHGGDFRRRGEEGRYRRRRAFVNVGRPHVERHRADLEGEAGEHEHQAEQQAERRRAARESGGDAGEAGRAGEAVEQRNAVEQDAAGERAEDEIFEAGFGRALVGAAVGSEHVAGEAVQLEPDIERDQAGRRDHHAMPTALNRISTGYSAPCSESRSNQPCAAMIATAAAGKMIALPKRAEQIGGDQPAEQGPGVRRRADQRGGGAEQQRDRRAS